MTAELDDTVLKATYKASSLVYKDACEEVGFSNQEIRHEYIEEEIDHKEMARLHEVLDEKYRELLCKLSTETLNNIITAWKSGQQRRNRKTIDTIGTELLQRELDESKGCN